MWEYIINRRTALKKMKTRSVSYSAMFIKVIGTSTVYQLFTDSLRVLLRFKITSANPQDFKEIKPFVLLVTITHLCLSRSALCIHSILIEDK